MRPMTHAAAFIIYALAELLGASPCAGGCNSVPEVPGDLRGQLVFRNRNHVNIPPLTFRRMGGAWRTIRVQSCWRRPIGLETRASLQRSPSAAAGLSRRARAVLLMADAVAGTEVAQRTGYTVVQVSRLRRRFAAEGLQGLEDKPRSGRPPSITGCTRAQIVAKTLKAPGHGLSHWSARELAAAVGVSHTTASSDLAGPRPATAPDRDLQIQHRSRRRGEDPRRGRTLLASAGQRGCPERRREDPDPGAESDPTSPAASAGLACPADP